MRRQAERVRIRREEAERAAAERARLEREAAERETGLQHQFWFHVIEILSLTFDLQLE